LQGAASAKFAAYIGPSKDGAIPARTYEFATARLGGHETGTYSSLMVKACKVFGMKPVCELAQYCKLDYHALYLGQVGHLSSHQKGGQRAGLDVIQRKWIGLCFYTNRGLGGATSAMALCNIPASSHTWKAPKQADPGFVCGREGKHAVPCHMICTHT